MGRYYSGDIQGKFWFGVQNSDAADRFGVIGHEPNYIEYYFTPDNLEDVQKELKRIEEYLGVYLNMLVQWYESEVSNYGDIQKYLNLDDAHMRNVISEYADYILGKKIEACIKEKGECLFSAEL